MPKMAPAGYPAFQYLQSGRVSNIQERTVSLWALPGGEQLHRYSLDDQPTGPLAFSPDGRTAAVGTIQGLIYLLRLPAPEPTNGAGPEGGIGAGQRSVQHFEGESLRVVNEDAGDVFSQDMRSYAGTWSGDRQFYWRCPGENRALALEIPVEGPGEFDVSAAFTTSYDYGKAILTLKGAVGSWTSPIDLYSPVTSRFVDRNFHRLALGPGGQTIRLEVKTTSRNPQSLGHKFGLDWIEFVRVR
jgi:hypothetical protein